MAGTTHRWLGVAGGVVGVGTLACAGLSPTPACPSLDEVGGVQFVYEFAGDVPPGGREQTVETIRTRLDALDRACTRVYLDGERLVVEGTDLGLDAQAIGGRGQLWIGPELDPVALPAADAVGAAPGTILPGSGGQPPSEVLRGLVARLEFAGTPLPQGARPVLELDHPSGGWRVRWLVASEAVGGSSIASADVAEDASTQHPYVRVDLDAEGRAGFAALTRERTGQVLLIVVDDVVLSAPIVREPITGGAVSIDLGLDATEEEAAALAVALRAGALPTPLVLQSERLIGPPPLRLDQRENRALPPGGL